MGVCQREIIVEVDPAPPLRQVDMLFGRERLAAKHRHAMFEHRPANRFERFALRLGQLDIVDGHAAFGRQRFASQDGGHGLSPHIHANIPYCRRSAKQGDRIREGQPVANLQTRC